MRQEKLRIADCRLRIGRATIKSAIRNPQSTIALLALLTLVAPGALPAQQWPVHSMDRPRPPVVDPGPERPPVPPPADAVVLFDGKDLEQWQAENGGAAKWVVRDGFLEVAPHTGAIQTKRGFGDVQLHLERSEEHTSELQSPDTISYAVFCLKKKK